LWLSSRPLPAIMSYWTPLLGTFCAPSRAKEHAVWERCQLVLMTRTGDDVVLDCLVPSSTGGVGRSSACVPMTLRAHELPQRQSSSELLSALEAWVDSDAFVDIEVERDAGTEVVHIFEASRLITLELVHAT
jgi:hypothetical protein